MTMGFAPSFLLPAAGLAHLGLIFPEPSPCRIGMRRGSSPTFTPWHPSLLSAFSRRSEPRRQCSDNVAGGPRHHIIAPRVPPWNPRSIPPPLSFLSLLPLWLP